MTETNFCKIIKDGKEIVDTNTTFITNILTESVELYEYICTFKYEVENSDSFGCNKWYNIIIVVYECGESKVSKFCDDFLNSINILYNFINKQFSCIKSIVTNKQGIINVTKYYNWELEEITNSISYDYRFNSELSPLCYYPLGLIYSECFKYRPERHSMWFKPVDVTKSHKVTLRSEHLYYDDLSNQVSMFIDTKVPKYIHEAIVSRSHRYDESDRVKCSFIGFILLNCFFKNVTFMSNSNLYFNNKYVSDHCPLHNKEIPERNLKVSIEAGIKWSKIQYNLNKLKDVLPLPKEIIDYEIKPYICDTYLTYIPTEDITLYEKDFTQLEWVCLITMFDKKEKQMIEKEINLFHDSLEWIGFPIPVNKGYKTAQVIFRNKTNKNQIFFKSDIIRLNNYNLYNFPNDIFYFN